MLGWPITMKSECIVVATVMGSPLQTFIDSKGMALEKNNELMFYKERTDSEELTDKKYSIN